jgi:uncharacterized membrane protein YoaK (UPF0700 family)
MGLDHSPLTVGAEANHIRRLRTGVRWQSGDASDCKSADAGSIPARTSNLSVLYGSVTDPDPTEQAPVGLTLLWLCAVLAGAVDARGIALLHDIFLAFMSGNTTMLAISLAQQDWQRARLIGLVIGTFVAGAAAGQIVADRAGRWRLPVVIAMVAALLGVPLIASDDSIEALTFAMGALNAAMQHAGKAAVSITFVTGALIRFGQGLGGLLGGRTGGWLWLAQAVPWTGLLVGAAAATLAMQLGVAMFHLALPVFAGVLVLLSAMAVRRSG